MIKQKHISFGLIIVLLSVSTGFTYQIKSYVLSNGGVETISAGFVLKGTVNQTTVSSPWVISPSGYRAVIGFWNPSYPTSIREKLSQSIGVYSNFLHQNNPNPFCKTTTINYSIAQEGHVSLKVYNILGQEITTLVDEKQNPGYYRILCDLSNASNNRLAGGVYFCRLQTKSYLKVRKMVFIR